MSSSKTAPSPTYSRAATLLLKMLDMRCRRYQDCFKLCQKEFSNEAVHDLRVATRRLLTLLEILEALFLGMKGRKLRRELKQQLDSLDELMDTQVQIAFLEDEMSEVQEIAAFIKYLYRREANLLKQVEHTVRGISIASQVRRLADIRQAAEARLQVPDVRSRLVSAVDGSFSNMLHRYARIDPAETDSIHRTRIAFKSFRYAVEIIHPLLVNYPAPLLKAMNEYQGLMGDIQDMEVLQDLLTAFGKKHPDANISAILAAVNEKHRLKVTEYISQKDRLQIFWRLSPHQPYPWNKATESTESTPVEGTA
jgi:CHAD domain-containing protein